MALHGLSEPCCTVPPAKAKYEGKGTYIEISGMKTYKTGPAGASTAILVVPDIFGFSAQVLQGADFLAEPGYQVYVPDVLRGEHYHPADLPPDTPEKRAKLGAFIEGPGAPSKTVPVVPTIVKAIEDKAEGTISKWGVVGLCWGAKVVSLSSGIGTPFSAVAEAHPSMIDPNDASKITIPTCVVASGDEDANTVKAFVEALKVSSYHETFDDQVHGFMAARGNLDDEKVCEQFTRGYQVIVNFFQKYL